MTTQKIGSSSRFDLRYLKAGLELKTRQVNNPTAIPSVDVPAMSRLDDPLPDLIRGLRSPLAEQRTRAARALGRLGWLARDAMRQLAQQLDDPEASVREAVAGAIGQMGTDALPYLITMLKHHDKYVRRHAVWAFGKLGSLAKDAVEPLCKALKDEDPRTASGAAQALGNMSYDAIEAIPCLAEAMRGTNIVLCRLASKAMSQIGRPAIATLMAHLRHRDPFVRGEAALALGWMGPTAGDAVPALTDALRASRPSDITKPAMPLDAATPVTPIVVNANQPSSEETSRIHVAQALGRIGPTAASAVPALEVASRDYSDRVRQAALNAIRAIQGDLVLTLG